MNKNKFFKIARDVFTILNIIMYFAKGFLSIPLFAFLIVGNILFLYLGNKEQFQSLFFSNKLLILVLFSVSIFIKAMYFLFHYGDMTIYSLVDQFRIGFAVLITLYYFDLKDAHYFKYLIYLSIFILLVLSVYTLYALGKYPTLLRLLATGNSFPENVQNINAKLLLNYDTIYGLVFICLYWIYTIRKSKDLFITIPLILLFSYTIYKAAFSIAILIYAFGIFCMLLYKKKYKLFLSFIVLFFIIRVPIAKLFYNVAKSINPWIGVRLIQIADLLSGKIDVNSELLERLTRIKISFQAFCRSPIIGMGGYYTTQNMTMRYIGGHSTLLDSFARYGLVFSSFYFSFFLFFFNYMKKEKVSPLITLSIPLFVLSIFNTMNFPCLLVFPLCIIPLLHRFCYNFFDRKQGDFLHE